MFEGPNKPKYPAEVVDKETIKRRFIELPPEEVQLLAVNLARKEGFIRSLVLGQIITSSELNERVGNKFVKTHRGYYMRFDPGNQLYISGHNDYISFNIGRAQKLYTRDADDYQEEENWDGGYGCAIPAEQIIDNSKTQCSWGCFNMPGLVKGEHYDGKNPELDNMIEKYPRFARFRKLKELSSNELWDYDHVPPKEDLIDLVHITRLRDHLRGTDQAEVNLHKQGDEYPRQNLDESVIFIPESEKDTIVADIEAELKLLQPFGDKIKALCGIDVTKLTAEQVLANYPNIYWYPQRNIGLAVLYLSTHPEEIKRIIS